MEHLTIINLLKNSGLENVRIDNGLIYFQDPACIFPAFDTFLEYAWIATLGFTAFLLFGWAILYIKNGVKLNDLFNNAWALVLILCIFGLIKPIVNVVYGNNLFAKQCDTVSVSMNEVQELLDLRNKNFSESDAALFENFDVSDTGPVFE